MPEQRPGEEDLAGVGLRARLADRHGHVRVAGRARYAAGGWAVRPSSFFGVRGVSFDDAPPARLSWGHERENAHEKVHRVSRRRLRAGVGVRRRLSPMTRSAMSTARGRRRRRRLRARGLGGDGGVAVSSEGDAAAVDGASFCDERFLPRAEGHEPRHRRAYRGYSYLAGHETGCFVQVVAADGCAVVYVPAAVASALGVDVSDTAVQDQLRNCLVALDAGQAAGSTPLSEIEDWRFTTETSYIDGAVRFEFDQEVDGGVYAFVIGSDGSDLTDTDNPNYLKTLLRRLRAHGGALRGRDSRRAHVDRIGGGFFAHA